jgi:hypothetical protein
MRVVESKNSQEAMAKLPRGGSLILSINVSAVSDSHNFYRLCTIINFIDYAIIPYSDAPVIFGASDFTTARWLRIFGQGFNV